MDKSIIKATWSMINESSNTIVLTGAGMSTESGIPDFRSPNSGLWEKIDPMEALSTRVLYNNPRKFYEVGYNILLSMTDAKPNKGHLALVEMERLGLIECVITQNIDGLHQKAGSRNVLEVHGHIRTASCLGCGNSVPLKSLQEKVRIDQIPPKCNECGGVLRPDVVMFGDNLPKDFNIAWDKAKNCELMIVIGSSLTVAPVNYLPQMAEYVILINYGETPFDRYADIVIKDGVGSVLTDILNEAKKERQNEVL